jgi:hypothetical protein
VLTKGEGCDVLLILLILPKESYSFASFSFQLGETYRGWVDTGATSQTKSNQERHADRTFVETIWEIEKIP